MAVLENIEPKKVFEYFEEICGMPHGSSNTQTISDYLVDFAKKRKLSVRQDNLGNVVIKKPGTQGYENAKTVMLQGHMDMVCEREAGVDIDFQKDGLHLLLEDGIIRAKGTTLGGDDGIAVAFVLAILDSEDIPHPPLEVVLTVDEEIGMLGATALDVSDLQASYLLNLDSEDEGQLLVGCAGGLTGTCHVPVSCESMDICDGEQAMLALSVDGLLGGHSGMEIIRQRGNANKLLGRTLRELSERGSFRLVDIDGGKKDNAIAREATAKFLVNRAESAALLHAVEDIGAVIKKEYETTDPSLQITGRVCDASETGERVRCFTKESTRRVIDLLFLLPNGVQRMSTEIEGLVQTSLNLGILTYDREKAEVLAGFSIRSSVGSEKELLSKKLAVLSERLGCAYTEQGAYPAWEYKKESKFRDVMVESFKELYGKPPVLDVIHAGVECGIFADKMKDLDCVSYGPDMSDIHTPKESLSVDSVRRTWEYTLKVLENLRQMR